MAVLSVALATMDAAALQVILEQQAAQIAQMNGLVTQLVEMNNQTRQQVVASDARAAAMEQQMADLRVRAERGGGNELRDQVKMIIDPKVLEKAPRFDGRDENFAVFEAKLRVPATLIGVHHLMEEWRKCSRWIPTTTSIWPL